MTTSTTHGVTPDWRGDWRESAACRDRPDEWDLDYLDRDGVIDALDVCKHHCRVRFECGVATDNQQPLPQGVVQAGRVWRSKNGKKVPL